MQPISQPSETALTSNFLPNDFQIIAGGAQKSVKVRTSTGETKTFIITVSKSDLNDAQFAQLLQTYDGTKSANIAEVALAMKLSEQADPATFKTPSFGPSKMEKLKSNVEFAKLSNSKELHVAPWRRNTAETEQIKLHHQEHIQEIKKIARSHGEIGSLVCIDKTGPTSFLDNFYDCSPNGITLGNMNFKSAEGAYHYYKFTHSYAELKQGRDKALAQGINNKAIDDQLKIFENFDKNRFFTANGEEACALDKELKQQGFEVAKSWDQGSQERDTYMWLILCAKFQDPYLKDLLKATNGAFLLAHSQDEQSDPHWTDQCLGTGNNVLGKMLMALRDLLEGNNPLKVDITVMTQVDDRETIMRYAAHANKNIKDVDYSS